MRDNNWLEEKMYEIWENHFDDVPRPNLVLIKFGKYSKRQLGSIKWVHERTKVKGFLSKKKEEHDLQDDSRISLITITKYFQDPKVPDEVVMGTIAHEMVHYAHGFHSPLEQRFRHPHQGKVVQKEMHARDLGHILEFSEKWLEKSWVKLIRNYKK